MDIEKFYNELRYQKDKFSLWDLPVLALVEKDKRTVEVGAGSGFFAQMIQEQGIPVACVDLSKTNIQACKEKNLQAFQVNIEKETLPFENGSFDQVIMVEVIEHLFDPFFPLSEINRILSPHGKLILSTHNALNIIMRFMFLSGNLNSTSDVSHKGRGEHIRIYSHKILKSVLEQAGFEIVSWHSWFYIPFVKRYLYPPFWARSLLSQHILIEARKKVI